jgi:hypothetical protein
MKYEQPYGITDPNASYINGNPQTATQGSIPPAAAFENPQREIVNFITKSGLTPTDSDLYQLGKSVRAGKVSYAQDIGTVNSLIVNLDPPLDAYTSGLVLRVKVAVTNTAAATTINVNGLGAVTIVRANGAAIDVGELTVNEVVELVYDGLKFQISNFLGLSAGSTYVNNYVTNIPYVVDSSAVANTIIANYAPAIGTLTDGEFMATKLKNSLTGAPMITVNANTPKPIIRTDGTALGAGDALAGEIMLLVYDLTRASFQYLAAKPVSKILTAPRNWYVNGATGNDSNDGMSPGTAFATIQHAIDTASQWNLAGFSIGIYVADYTAYAPFSCKPAGGAGGIMIQGNPSNPGNVQVGGAGTAINITAGDQYTINGLHVSSTGPVGADPGNGVWCQNSGSNIVLNNMDYGYCPYCAIASEDLGSIILAGTQTFHTGTGPGGAAIRSLNANVRSNSPTRPTLQFPASYNSSYFVLCQLLGQVQLPFASIIGAANVLGQSYHIDTNSVGAAGGSVWPGTPGATSTGGLFTP